MASFLTNLIYIFCFVFSAVAFFICTEYIAMFIERMHSPCNPEDSQFSFRSPYTNTTPTNNSSPSDFSNTTRNYTNTNFTIDPCDVVLIVLTGSTYHDTRLRDIKATYMKHTCQTDPRKNVLFISDKQNDTIPTIGVPCDNGYDTSLCCKVLYGWRAAFRLYPRAKYFLQLDDDSYVVMKNLLTFLAHFDPEEPLFTGHPLYVTLDSDGNTLNQGGDKRITEDDLVYAAGWLGIMTRPSLSRIFTRKLDQIFFSVCQTYFWPDLVTGFIMRSAGILFTEENFGYNTGWGIGYAPLKPENAAHKSKTIGTHTYHDTKLMFVYEQYYHPRQGS